MTGPAHLSIVGLGPGDPRHRTLAATEAVRGAAAVVGYGPYVDLCADLLTPGQEVVRGGMGEEAERAVEAVGRAATGTRTALVSSGDAGVFGMAALALRAAHLLVPDERPSVEVVPGVTAAVSAAARLGAPLADFAAISLSDVLEPWEAVRARLAAVAVADLGLVLYNPRSSRRTEQFDKALAVLRAARDAATPAALCRQVGRPDERVLVTTLGALDPELVDMSTTVVVGSAATQRLGDLLVTARGRA